MFKCGLVSISWFEASVCQSCCYLLRIQTQIHTRAQCVPMLSSNSKFVSRITRPSSRPNRWIKVPSTEHTPTKTRVQRQSFVLISATTSGNEIGVVSVVSRMCNLCNDVLVIVHAYPVTWSSVYLCSRGSGVTSVSTVHILKFF